MVFEGDFVARQHRADRRRRSARTPRSSRSRRSATTAPVVTGGDAAVALKDSQGRAGAADLPRLDGRGGDLGRARAASSRRTRTWTRRAYPNDVQREIAKALIAAGDDFRFDMSDQAPAAVRRHAGQGRVEGPPGLPEEPDGRRGRPGRSWRRTRPRRTGTADGGLMASAGDDGGGARRAADAPRRTAQERDGHPAVRWRCCSCCPRWCCSARSWSTRSGTRSAAASSTQSGDGFVGLDNYAEIFTDDAHPAPRCKNNAIWVVVAPTVATALGLIFAVLTERVRWGTAFKLIVFMPMAISMLAAGIIFRLVYEQDPDQGVANAVVGRACTTPSPSPSAFPKARPRPAQSPLEAGRRRRVRHQGAGHARAARSLLPLVGVAPDQMPADATGREGRQPRRREGHRHRLAGLHPGRRRQAERDRPERAGPRRACKVEAVKDGKVVASATAGADGTFTPARDGRRGPTAAARARTSRSRTTASTGSARRWSPRPSSASYVWMWAGFAMVLIAAGLAGVPRELLEAARVDGANEWQVFRRITVPLLAPVLVGRPRHPDDQRAEDLRPGLHHRAGLRPGRRQRARAPAVPVVVRRRTPTSGSAARSPCSCCCSCCR